MLSSVLNSERAIIVNIQIMRIFTKFGEMLTDNLSLKLEIDEIKTKLKNQDKNIELVFKYLDELVKNKKILLPGKELGSSFKRNKMPASLPMFPLITNMIFNFMD